MPGKNGKTNPGDSYSPTHKDYHSKWYKEIPRTRQKKQQLQNRFILSDLQRKDEPQKSQNNHKGN